MRINLKKSSNTSNIDMTAMLDVIFILLIFFVVTTSFDRTQSINITRPKVSHSTKKPTEKVEIMLSADGTLTINHNTVTLLELSQQLNELFVVNQDSNTSNRRSKYLLIQADENSRHGDLIKIMDIAKEIGIEKIAIGVDPKK